MIIPKSIPGVEHFATDPNNLPATNSNEEWIDTHWWWNSCWCTRRSPWCRARWTIGGNTWPPVLGRGARMGPRPRVSRWSSGFRCRWSSAPSTGTRNNCPGQAAPNRLSPSSHFAPRRWGWRADPGLKKTAFFTFHWTEAQTIRED